MANFNKINWGSQPQMASGMPMPGGYGNMKTIELHNPAMPFTYPIISLSPGNQIRVSGRPNYSATRFSVDLKGQNGDIVFHFNPRFDEGQVVRNTLSGGSWGAEERTAPYFPFTPGVTFDIQIVIQQSDFIVSVNGQHFVTYRRRLPYNYIQSIEVCGDVTLTNVTINGGQVQTMQASVPAQTVSTSYYRRGNRLSKTVVVQQTYPQLPVPSAPSPTYGTPMSVIHNPAMPFTIGIQLHDGKVIRIKGQVKQFVDRFRVDLTSANDDIPFHFTPRFSEHAVVRNTRTRGNWGSEERDMPYFPFISGQRFDMQIVVEAGSYVISINGQRFASYRHRLAFSGVNFLFIEGDVVVDEVTF